MANKTNASGKATFHGDVADIATFVKMNRLFHLIKF